MKKIDEQILEEDDEVVLEEDDEILLSEGQRPILEAAPWETGGSAERGARRRGPSGPGSSHPPPALPFPADHTPGSAVVEPVPDATLAAPAPPPVRAPRGEMPQPPAGTPHEVARGGGDRGTAPSPAARSRADPRRRASLRWTGAALVATVLAVLWVNHAPGPGASHPSPPSARAAGEGQLTHPPMARAASGGRAPGRGAHTTAQADGRATGTGPLAPPRPRPPEPAGPGPQAQARRLERGPAQLAPSPAHTVARNGTSSAPVESHAQLAGPQAPGGPRLAQGTQTPSAPTARVTRYGVAGPTPMHSQASTLSPIVDILQPGEEATGLGRIAGTHWYRVRGTSGISGYVYAAAQEWPPMPARARADTGRNPRLIPLNEASAAVSGIPQLLHRAEAHFRADRLTAPRFENALSLYRKVLRLDSDNPQALEGIGRIKARLARYAQEAEERGDVTEAQNLLIKILRVDPHDRQAKAGLSDLKAAP